MKFSCKAFWLKLALCGVAAMILATGQAQATTYGGDLTTFLNGYSFTSFKGPLAVGQYYITPLFTEAGHKLYFGSEGKNYIFDNKTPGGWSTQLVDVDKDSGFFKDATGAEKVFVAKENSWEYGKYPDWDFTNKLMGYVIGGGSGALGLKAGDLIIGYNDLGGDRDFDDFIVKANPVPLPAAFWLLGSGVVALVGLRKRFKA